jgi:hypothetical protein
MGRARSRVNLISHPRFGVSFGLNQDHRYGISHTSLCVFTHRDGHASHELRINFPKIKGQVTTSSGGSQAGTKFDAQTRWEFVSTLKIQLSYPIYERLDDLIYRRDYPTLR